MQAQIVKARPLQAPLRLTHGDTSVGAAVLTIAQHHGTMLAPFTVAKQYCMRAYKQWRSAGSGATAARGSVTQPHELRNGTHLLPNGSKAHAGASHSSQGAAAALAQHHAVNGGWQHDGLPAAPQQLHGANGFHTSATHLAGSDNMLDGNAEGAAATDHSHQGLRWHAGLQMDGVSGFPASGASPAKFF